LDFFYDNQLAEDRETAVHLQITIWRGAVRDSMLISDFSLSCPDAHSSSLNLRSQIDVSLHQPHPHRHLGGSPFHQQIAIKPATSEIKPAQNQYG